MKFTEIVNRLTGVSLPIFGISWQPPEPQVTVARRVVTFLEDRRVLYSPYEMEIPDHCVFSILEIREFLTAELAKLESSNELTASLRAMRTACRKFLDTVGFNRNDLDGIIRHRVQMDSWVFNCALGELRGVFGIHIARLAAHHGLDVENDLAAILPNKDL